MNLDKKQKLSEDGKDREIIEEALTRFDYLMGLDSENRDLWREDLKFANGDADNGWQMEGDIFASRIQSGKPCLTVNKVKAHNRAITNEYRMNRTSPKVIPSGGGSDKETAEVFNSIIRHIEAQSSADTVYSTAFEFAVDAGLGYYRVVTDYLHEESFDQEIYLRRVKNPLNILQHIGDFADGRDSKYAFDFTDLPVDEFKELYPNETVADFNRSNGSDWITEDTVRLCEYFRVVGKEDTLYSLPDGTTILKSKLKEEDGIDVTGLKSRKVTNNSVEWFLLGNNTILDRSTWAGKYIPIIRVVGFEVEVENKLYRCGHTRAMKDVQRMYNFWTSSAVESVSLHGKQPYIVSAEAIAGFADEWDNLNEDDVAYLPYNHADSRGNPIPPPVKQEGAAIPTAYLQGMKTASDEMQAITGQYDAQMGQTINAQSGIAIDNLQRKGDVATYHFIDNAEQAKIFTTVLLVDLIPKIYDTPRVVRILGEDSKEAEIEVNPELPAAKVSLLDEQGEIKTIYNPSVGRYDVQGATGANYATQRREQSAALLAMTQANPDLWNTAGDLILKSQDFPMSEEIGERLAKLINPPKQEVGDIPPDVQQHLQAQESMIKAMDATIVQMQADLNKKDVQLVEKDKADLLKAREIMIKEYEAETDRMKVLEPSMSPEAIRALVIQMMIDVREAPPIDLVDTGAMVENQLVRSELSQAI
jgi:hypothetical protein